MRRKLLQFLSLQPASASQLASELEESRATLTRHLKAMTGEVIQVGRHRGAKWFRLRYSSNNGAGGWPIYRVSADGEVEHFADIYAVYPDDNYLVNYLIDYPDDYLIFDSLPWWMTDMRPQGFLGRKLAESQQVRAFQLDLDPDRWSEDQVLRVLTNIPHDTVGNLLLGDRAYQHWLHTEARSYQRSDLEQLVYDVVHGESWHSTPGGEHAKLSITLEGVPSIIKFSAPLDGNQTATRWADLLHCEALASEVLNQFEGNLAARNISFVEQNRAYLSSQRFDRIGSLGRIGVVSLKALDAEFCGLGRADYPQLLEALTYSSGTLTEQAYRKGMIAFTFGTLIGNNDMHFGNLSALHEGLRPLELAPIYDCLPMAYAPRRDGSLLNEPLVFDIAAPRVTRMYWQVGYELAQEFWQAVIQHPKISDDFKALARQNHERVLALKPIIERMA